MGCRCVYPAHVGVGDIYAVADAGLACADQGKPDMGVGVAVDLSALPADCGQMFGVERRAAGGEYFCLPARLRHIERTRFAAHRLYPPGPAEIGGAVCRVLNSKI